VNRLGVTERFSDASVQTAVRSDLALAEHLDEQLRGIESNLVQQFVSYCRLVKYAHESAGKLTLGGKGNKIGNAHLKWAFSEASLLMLREPSRSQRTQSFGFVMNRGPDRASFRVPVPVTKS